MKKISEIIIGTKILRSYYGSKTLFMYRNSKPDTKYHKNGISQAYCACCDSFFTTGNNYLYYHLDKMICPGCGYVHSKNNISYTTTDQDLLPAKIRISLIEFKEKIELRMTYFANIIGKNIFNDFKEEVKTYEKITFDIAQKTAVWERKVPLMNMYEKQEIGYYMEDYNATGVFKKSVLKFFDYRHKIYRGDSFTILLKKLRNCVNKKMLNKGLCQKSLFVTGCNDKRLLGAVLNVAHRVRFWDFDNLPNFNESFEERRSNSNFQLKSGWMQDVEALQKKEKITLLQSMITYFQLPNCKTVRKNILCLEKMQDTILAFSASKKISEGEFLYKYFRQLTTHPRLVHKKEIVFFVKNILPFYKQYSLTHIVQLRNLADINRLFRMMNQTVRKSFLERPIQLKLLHNWLSVEISKMPENEKYFDVPEHIKARFKMQLDVYNTSVVSRYSELKNLAIKLKNCAAGYKHSINENVQIVAVTDKRGSIVAALELSKGNLVQAKLFDNQAINKDLQLNKIIVEFAQKTGLTIKTNDVNTEKIA